MLGVGRSYISRVIASLKDRDVLGTRRGVLVIPDLARLQALACGCHDAVLDHFDEVLSGVYPSEEELVTVCS